MQLPIVSAGLTVARAVRGLTITETATLAGVTPDDVFDAGDFLDDVDYFTVIKLANVLGVNLDKLLGRH